jgi:hypothetical protein
MININEVKTGIIPFGGGVGIKALGVNYSINDTEIKDVETEVTQVINQIKDKYPDDFVSALKSKIQFCWVGNGLENKEYTEFADKLFMELSKESLELQKKDQLKAHQMRPPFFVYVGKPLVYTGSREFYQQFNYLIVDCPTKTPSGEIVTQKNATEAYSLTALVEIANHNFSQFLFRIDDEKELKVIIDVYLANSIPVHGDRIIIIPGDAKNKELANACALFAEKNRIRLGVNYKDVYDNVLNFDL